MDTDRLSPDHLIKEAKDCILEGLSSAKEAMASVEGLPLMFENCFMNTISTTVKMDAEGCFVITGDIPAMWLRDSTAQVLHYLRFVSEEPVRKIIEQLLDRQMRLILLDPYANAFNQTESDFDNGDRPRASGFVWERKYELDSLCYPLWLAQKYYDRVGHGPWLNERFYEALRCIVELMAKEQYHAEESDYRFHRENCLESDTLSNNGIGSPVGYTGMVYSAFRPSDDSCRYHYLIPSNLFASHVLKSAAFFAGLFDDPDLALKANALSAEIWEGVMTYGTVDHPEFGKILSYETDGMDHHLLMDDANVPSLLSLPYLGCLNKEDELYQNTRAFVLSLKNPFYFEGKAGKGIGSPHTPDRYIWPISLCMQMMTSSSLAEKRLMLKTLLGTHAGTGLMHEGFDADDPTQFTRPWFAWANSLFGEALMRLYETEELPPVLEGLVSAEIAPTPIK